MDLDTQVKLAVYRHFAETGRRPKPAEVAARAGVDEGQVPAAYVRLRAQRVLVTEADGSASVHYLVRLGRQRPTSLE